MPSCHFSVAAGFSLRLIISPQKRSLKAAAAFMNAPGIIINFFI
jgi:hypothetical protein